MPNIIIFKLYSKILEPINRSSRSLAVAAKLLISESVVEFKHIMLINIFKYFSKMQGKIVFLRKNLAL